MRVIEGIHQTDRAYGAETVGVIEGWEDEPTGAWYVHSCDGKFPIRRLKLRKPDGEISILTVDDQMQVCPLEPKGECSTNLAGTVPRTNHRAGKSFNNRLARGR